MPTSARSATKLTSRSSVPYLSIVGGFGEHATRVPALRAEKRVREEARHEDREPQQANDEADRQHDHRHAEREPRDHERKANDDREGVAEKDAKDRRDVTW